eukprot:CAMPEP_0116872344 /NCGR_PEP_ID=MMETSP0463-20121206/3082_1 /TAXON_ID=181622 /ORGANISM="Strombidinopsis sp, Strain SopsisLIS2011" /LENGTH=62 /DNA_ID=CAMNT_0004512447 /DNA_START=2232 /DNA_END=2420 /DNA_ORIENTATION=+
MPSASRDNGALSAPVARDEPMPPPPQTSNRVNVVEVMPNPSGDGGTTTVVRRGMAASTDEIG